MSRHYFEYSVVRVALCSLSIAALTIHTPLYANPLDGQVVGGSATISSNTSPPRANGSGASGWTA